MPRLVTKNHITRRDITALHDRLLDAVAFVPVDEGNDDRNVMVSLRDLRELVSAAWEAERVARVACRRQRAAERNFREAVEKVELFRERGA